jgi:hypothetical protein
VTERWYKIRKRGERDWQPLVAVRDDDIQRGDVLPLGDGDESGYKVLSVEPDAEPHYTARLVVEVVALNGEGSGSRPGEGEA